MPKWIKKWRVPRSTGDGEWVVSQADDGTWGCSCPVWKFRRAICHHIIAVQTNPDAYGQNGTNKVALPEIVPGNVEEVTVIDGMALHPLIPLGQEGTGILATVLYDLMALGYGFGQLRERFHFIPREWTRGAVVEHVKRYGRTIVKTEFHGVGLPTYIYKQIPVEVGALTD